MSDDVSGLEQFLAALVKENPQRVALAWLNRTQEALTLLRAALRKFPDSIEAASSYATLCIDHGQPDEAERTYLALYEKTTDAAARLRLIGPLAQAAQQHNGLPRLLENFQQRQQQNRASAQPWLALAEIHRATSNDEARRRCCMKPHVCGRKTSGCCSTLHAARRRSDSRPKHCVRWRARQSWTKRARHGKHRARAD